MRQGKPYADAFHHKLVGNKVTKVVWQDIKPVIMIVVSFSHKTLLASLWISSLSIASNFFLKSSFDIMHCCGSSVSTASFNVLHMQQYVCHLVRFLFLLVLISTDNIES